jgi:hypothetical protein
MNLQDSDLKELIQQFYAVHERGFFRANFQKIYWIKKGKAEKFKGFFSFPDTCLIINLSNAIFINSLYKYKHKVLEFQRFVYKLKTLTEFILLYF